MFLLRYKPEELKEISISLTTVIDKYGDALQGKFTVITAKKIRTREIW
ncbi:hypothetical protein [Thermodesulfovibrio hydrogeniphilus]